jgi:hypothetical protein
MDVSGVMMTVAGVLGPDALPSFSDRPKPRPCGDVGPCAVECEMGRVEGAYGSYTLCTPLLIDEGK